MERSGRSRIQAESRPVWLGTISAARRIPRQSSAPELVNALTPELPGDFVVERVGRGRSLGIATEAFDFRWQGSAQMPMTRAR